MFQQEMGIRRKSPTVGFLLCFFLGGVGAHRFYLGDAKLGILYACFFWTLIPEAVSIVELFLIMKRVRVYNTERALEVVTKLKMLRPGASGEQPALPAAGQSKSGTAKTLAAAAGGAVAGAALATAAGTGIEEAAADADASVLDADGGESASSTADVLGSLLE